ncbi:hypothetical protein KR093_004323 [Drosophila rubida]|uniref:Alpha 1,4-glycosyltransferase domain-containing protein n=1 Tax=Drosophila rubida TaxID=30044 RepID=A0AAD4PN84_9MUSC|nr:hypothetical protein KR093_004323 [Drosophila rubida]
MFSLKTITTIAFANWGRRIFILFLICSFVLIIGISFISKPKIYHCFMDTDLTDHEDLSSSKDESNLLRNILFAKEKPISGRTIFFVESKCNCSDSGYTNLNFTAHQACAIESAALHHSSYEVFALVACPSIRQQIDPVLDALLSYKNVKVRYVNLWRFAAGTPIEDWLKKDDLFHTKYKLKFRIKIHSQFSSLRYLMVNISDLLRILALYRYGGIYMDTDVVVLRSFAAEPPNFMAAETKTSIANGVFGIEPNGVGDQLAKQLLIGFQKYYSGNIWAYNGPKLFSRVMFEICGTKDINLMQNDPDRCQGIKVFDIDAFYKITWIERRGFFKPHLANATLRRLKDAYVTHLWNHIKTDWPIRVDSGAAYMQLAAKHCPKVLAATGKYFT